MTGAARPLEPTGDRLRALLAEAVEYVIRTVDDITAGPVSDTDGIRALVADPAIRRPPPADPTPIAELIRTIDRAAGKGVFPPSPGMMAFIPGSGLVATAIADLLSGVLNRYTGEAYPAPGFVALETTVLRWLVDLFGLPPTATGLLTTGGSLATFAAIITARDASPHGTSGTIYVTDQAHLSAAKAAHLAGFPADAIRTVPVDAELRMAPAALDDAVAKDDRPFLVVASAGTTNAGTIDPLPALADIASKSRMWLHVDAAYGGFFQLTDRGRALLRGIERADSIVVDAHKGLFLPFGTGGLLIRDGELLRRAHSGPVADYLQDIQEDIGLPNFADYGPELTRDSRGLRMWLPLHLHGVDAFRAALDEKLDLAEHAHRELSTDENVTVVGPVGLSTVVFHHDTDATTEELLARVNAERRVFLTSTRINGRYVGRICVLNHRTDRARVDEAVTAIRRHAKVLHQKPGTRREPAPGSP